MLFNTTDWKKIDRPFSDMDGWRVLASDSGTAGTVEELLWNPDTHSILRRRWWPKSSVTAAGEVWFGYIG